MKTMSKLMRGVAALTGLAVAASSAPAWAQGACVNDKTISAMQIRIAQTELMVAGLSCKQYDHFAEIANIKRYNAFVTRYQPILMNDGHRVLKRFFPTEQRLNDYLTRLANEAQLRGNANMAIFCTQAGKIYDDLLNQGPVELAAYSASLPMSSKHGHTPCNAPAPVVAPAPEVPAAPHAAPAPEAKIEQKTQTIAAVIAANDVPAGTAFGTMQPVPDLSMRPAVKNPPKPMLKPEGI